MGFFSGMVFTKISIKCSAEDSLLYLSDSVGYYAVCTRWGNPDTTNHFKSSHELIRVEGGQDVEICDEEAELEWWFKHLVAMFIV